MTENELRGHARVIANMAKNELRRTGNCDGVIAIINDGRIHRCRLIESTVKEIAGAEWLNNSAMKAGVFEVLRAMTASTLQEAVAFASVVNQYMATAKLTALPHEEGDRVTAGLSCAELVAQGWMHPPFDAVMATVQTAELVCVFTQRYDRVERMFLGEPTIGCMEQARYTGALKFFGAPVNSEVQAAADELVLGRKIRRPASSVPPRKM
jgi:hypothetical protein